VLALLVSRATRAPLEPPPLLPPAIVASGSHCVAMQETTALHSALVHAASNFALHSA
jgi:hypothetical protein